MFGSCFRTLAAIHVSDFWAPDGLRPEKGLGLTLYCRRASHVCGPPEPPPGWRTSRSGGLAARGSTPGCWCCLQRRWVAPRTPQSARVNCSPSGEEFFVCLVILTIRICDQTDMTISKYTKIFCCSWQLSGYVRTIMDNDIWQKQSEAISSFYFWQLFTKSHYQNKGCSIVFSIVTEINARCNQKNKENNPKSAGMRIYQHFSSCF